MHFAYVEVKLRSLHICQFSSTILSSRLKPKDTHDFFLPWLLTNEKHSSFLSRSKRAESDARGQINYPNQPFPLSSPSDTPEKSGPYQRLKGPSASQASYFLPFYFTVTFHCSFSFPQPLSFYPISLCPFHLFFFLLYFNPNSHHYLASACHCVPFPFPIMTV